MCICFVYINNEAKENSFQLIIINNRDEFYNRPTIPAHFWNKECISGLDNEKGKEGGTWFGANRFGKVGFLLNILDGNLKNEGQGRGNLVKEFLVSSESALEYSKKIDKTIYNPFNLILLEKKGNIWSTVYTSSYEKGPPKILEPGFLFFGNSGQNQPWKKIERSREKFKQILEVFGYVEKLEILVDQLIGLLKDDFCTWPDDQLKSQLKQDDNTEIVGKKLSSNFVDLRPLVPFGTRTHTLLLIDGKGNGEYREITLDDGSWNTNIIKFYMDDTTNLT